MKETKEIIEVYIDYGNCTEVIAYFRCEEEYMACINELKEIARENRGVLGESVFPGKFIIEEKKK